MKRILPGRVVSLGMKTSAELRSRVDICESIRHRAGDLLKQLGAGKTVFIVTQSSIPARFVADVQECLAAEGFTFATYSLPDGESCKSSEQLLILWEKMQALSMERNDTVLAIGGGAVTDVTGFAAATYLRGVRCVLIPTTLLAQVDASIGGKTAINLSAGKNLAGVVRMPDAVLIDSDFIATLPPREFRSGLGEIAKYAFIEKTIAQNTEYRIGPKLLMDVLKSFSTREQADDPSLSAVITACVRMKLAVVAVDPYEGHLRRCLNLGHTLGHAIEKVSSYQVSHGEAVSMGTAFAMHASRRLGRISPEQASSAIALLTHLNLPIEVPAGLPISDLITAMMSDKKKHGAAIRYVLPASEPATVDLDSLLGAEQLESLLKEFTTGAPR